MWLMYLLLWDHSVHNRLSLWDHNLLLWDHSLHFRRSCSMCRHRHLHGRRHRNRLSSLQWLSQE